MTIFAMGDYSCMLSPVDKGIQKIDDLNLWVAEKKKWCMDKVDEYIEKAKKKFEDPTSSSAPSEPSDPCWEVCKTRIQQYEESITSIQNSVQPLTEKINTLNVQIQDINKKIIETDDPQERARLLAEKDALVQQRNKVQTQKDNLLSQQKNLESGRKQAYVNIICEEYLNPKINEKLEDIRAEIIAKGQASVGFILKILEPIQPLLVSPTDPLSIIEWINNVISLISDVISSIQETLSLIPMHVESTMSSISDLQAQCGASKTDPSSSEPISFDAISIEFQPISMEDFMNGRKWPEFNYKKPTKSRPLPPPLCYSSERSPISPE